MGQVEAASFEVETQHRAAGGLGSVEGLVQRHELDAPGPQRHSAARRSRAAHGRVRRSGRPCPRRQPASDGGDHLQEPRAVEVLAAGALLAEDPGDELRGLARGDRGAEAGLLGLQRALVAERVVGGDAGVERDAESLGRGGRGGAVAGGGWSPVCASSLGTTTPACRRGGHRTRGGFSAFPTVVEGYRTSNRTVAPGSRTHVSGR
jgi:hypothetical protein